MVLISYSPSVKIDEQPYFWHLAELYYRECFGNPLLTVSDPTIASLSDYKETESGYSLEVIGKKGATNVTITDNENHVIRKYEITVSDEDVIQDEKIHLLGDVTGNGRVNVGDVSKLYAHIKGTKELC